MFMHTGKAFSHTFVEQDIPGSTNERLSLSLRRLPGSNWWSQKWFSNSRADQERRKGGEDDGKSINLVYDFKDRRQLAHKFFNG